MKLFGVQHGARAARRRRGLPPFNNNYQADAIHLDGNAFLSIASLTGSAGTPFLSVSCFYKNLNAVPATSGSLFVVDPDSDYTNNLFQQSNAWSLVTSSPEFNEADEWDNLNKGAADAWHHLLFSVDTNHPQGQRILKAYLDDAALNVGVSTDSGDAYDMVFNALKFAVFGDGSAGLTGDVADLWIAPGQSLLTADDIPEATRRKFISASGRPVDLGADGSTPTGTAPAVFFSGDFAEFATNKGTGGAFTLTGTLTNASTSPSD